MKLSLLKKAPLALVATLAFAAGQANAALITSAPGGSTVIDLPSTHMFDVSGAVQIGTGGENITVESSNSTNGLYFNWNGWGLLSNGNWGNGLNFVGLNDSNDKMIFKFNSGPVSSVGGFVNYAPGFANFVITALDASMNVLESYDVAALAPITTPWGFNQGAFRGIDTGVNNIVYFELSNGLANVLADLTFTRDGSQVPEPAPIALLGLGLAGLAASRRRKA